MARFKLIPIHLKKKPRIFLQHQGYNAYFLVVPKSMPKCKLNAILFVGYIEHIMKHVVILDARC